VNLCKSDLGPALCKLRPAIYGCGISGGALVHSKETFKKDIQKRRSKETFKRDIQKRHSKETFKRDIQKRHSKESACIVGIQKRLASGGCDRQKRALYFCKIDL